MIDWIPIVGIVTSTVMVIWVVALVTKSRERRVEAQVAMQSKLIERFGSAPELVQFLHSPAGRQFVAGVQGAPTTLTRERIMSGFTRAIIMTFLGLAFTVIAILERDSGWYIPASIVFALGLGYLLATFLSWRLAQSIREDNALPPLPGTETRA